MFDRTFFVLSPSYHGATLLAKLINAHPAITSLGDTLPSNRFDQTCGCGEKVGQCPFWQAVKAEIGAERHVNHARLMLPLYPRERDGGGGGRGRLAYSDFTSFWAMPRVLRRIHRRQALQAFRDDFQAFLGAVHRYTPQPGTVFVDGVKFVSRMSALQAAGEAIDGVIHLYRDPVDFVASSMRNTGRDGWRGLVEHSLRYRAYHARAHQAARHVGSELLLSYEGLADDIDAELARLFEYLGVEPMTVEALRPHLDHEWHFMGNASLFKFDGVIRRSPHDVPEPYRAWINALAGH